METIDSLAEAINNFDGGMVLVSHDFRLISQVLKINILHICHFYCNYKLLLIIYLTVSYLVIMYLIELGICNLKYY